MDKAEIIAAMRAAGLAAPVVVLVALPKRDRAFEMIATNAAGERKSTRVSASRGVVNDADVKAAIEILKA
jgi:hypothetical protein